jgi:hypothetical protein
MNDSHHADLCRRSAERKERRRLRIAADIERIKCETQQQPDAANLMEAM